MTPAEIRTGFANLNIWQRGDQRAPHKPLLVLYALGKLSRGEGPQIPYREVDEDLRRRLHHKTFDPVRSLSPTSGFFACRSGRLGGMGSRSG